MTNKVDITVVLMTHGEGKLLIPTHQNFLEGIAHAENAGLSIERIVTVDNPTKETSKVVAQLDMSGFIRMDLELGDLGKVRNEAVKIAKGKYFAILDGDDLWTPNWLLEAYKLSEASDDELVVHPEMNWLFEESNNIFYHPDESDSRYSHDMFRSTNPWDSLCFCKTSLVNAFPYVKRQIKQGFAYEDWNWNMRVKEYGARHCVAKETIVFKRRRSASQGAQAAKRGVITKPALLSYYDSGIYTND